ncbi:MAG: hypothetical protein ABL893_14435 [Hyphomicrobium sp.]
MLGRSELTSVERRGLLVGRMPDSAECNSPIVCVCHQVITAVLEGIAAKGCSTSEMVGNACRAGTNCG